MKKTPLLLCLSFLTTFSTMAADSHQIFFKVIKGPLTGKIFPIPEGESSIGRHVSREIIIDDGTIAKRHAVVTRKGEDVKISDTGTLNGTYVNGMRIVENLPTPLKSGDQVKLGKVEMEYINH